MCGEKISMFVVGNSKKPRCFNGIRRTACRYCARNKSWMDSKLFEEWIREQTKGTRQKNVRQHWLLITEGVIQQLKCKYISRIVQKNIRAIDTGKQTPSISVLEAIKMLVLSSIEVSETSIINCLLKAEIKEGMPNEDDDSFTALKSSIDQLQQRNENLVPNDFIYKGILTVDNNVAVMGGVMTDEEIVQDKIQIERVNETNIIFGFKKKLYTIINVILYINSSREI